MAAWSGRSSTPRGVLGAEFTMIKQLQPAHAVPRGAVLDRPQSSPDRAGNVDSADATPPKWRAFGALGGVLALGAAAFFVSSADRADVFEPIAEPAVAASDLSLGSMYHVVDQIGARHLWSQGITGTGVNVAVIDTGVAPVDGLLGDGKIVAAVDLSSEGGSPATAFVDANGHGTHLAGIIAGRETAADPALAAEHPEWFLGVAPDAGIVSVKVGDRSGAVQPGALVAAVDWVIQNAEANDIRVINLAVGTESPLPYQQDALAAAVERAWDAGIVVVTAAGNDGVDADGLASPANDPYVIAVAGAKATDGGFITPEWASSGDGVRDPDVSAPGAHIESLRAPGSDADVNHPEGYVDAETFKGSGSSQAAAVVSGLAALLLDARPELTNDQVKALLADTASPLTASTRVAGAGLIDAVAAHDAAAPQAQQDWPRATVSAPSADAAVVAPTWSGASWYGASWYGASWYGASWYGASWYGASWYGASWYGASWYGASWYGASWYGASW